MPKQGYHKRGQTKQPHHERDARGSGGNQVMKKLNVQGRDIAMSKINDEDYISLSDMAKDFGGADQLKTG